MDVHNSGLNICERLCKNKSALDVLDDYTSLYSSDRPQADQLKAHLMKKLEAEIPVELLDKVKKITHRFILLVGNDMKLAEALGFYYFCVKGETPFYHYSLCNKAEEASGVKEAKDEVKAFFYGLNLSFYNGNGKFRTGNLRNRFEQDCSIFFDRLGCKENPFLVCLEKELSSIASQRGMLIITTSTPLDEIYKPFKSLFEVIPLEAEKQKETVEITSNQKKTKNIIHFPTPSGTQWHEVTISFIDNENVRIIAKNVTETKHYSEMGFRKGKANKPVASWFILEGFKNDKPLEYPQNTKEKTEKTIQDLRKRLKAYFRIQGDPIILEQGYKPVFKVYWGASESRSVHAFLNSDILDEKEDD